MLKLTPRQKEVYNFMLRNNGVFGDMTEAAIEYSKMKNGDPKNPKGAVAYKIAGSENGILPDINELMDMGYVFISVEKTLKVRELPRHLT
jgi:hypothetical protein